MEKLQQRQPFHNVWINRLSIGFRIGFGLIFIVSGGAKLTDLAAFAEALRNFDLIAAKLLAMAAILIPVAEIALGVIIVVGFKIAIASQVAVALLTLFTAVIAAKLSEGAEISCACFGAMSNEKISATTIGRNIFFIVWGVVLFSRSSSSRSSAHGEPDYARQNNPAVQTAQNFLRTGFWKNLQYIVSFVAVFFLAVEVILLSRQNKELKNRLAGFIGNGSADILASGDLVPSFTALNSDGEEVEIAYSEMAANTLLFVLAVDCGACQRNLDNWSNIASRLEKSPCRVLGVALDPLDKIKNYVIAHQLNYPVFVPADTGFVRNYKPFVTPQTLLIGATGRVEKIWIGVLEAPQQEEILALLKR